MFREIVRRRRPKTRRRRTTETRLLRGLVDTTPMCRSCTEFETRAAFPPGHGASALFGWVATGASRRRNSTQQRVDQPRDEIRQGRANRMICLSRMDPESSTTNSRSILSARGLLLRRRNRRGGARGAPGVGTRASFLLLRTGCPLPPPPAPCEQESGQAPHGWRRRFGRVDRELRTNASPCPDMGSAHDTALYDDARRRPDGYGPAWRGVQTGTGGAKSYLQSTTVRLHTRWAGVTPAHRDRVLLAWLASSSLAGLKSKRIGAIHIPVPSCVTRDGERRARRTSP